MECFLLKSTGMDLIMLFYFHKKMKIRLEPLDILKCVIWLADKILLIQAMEPLFTDSKTNI